ncbi:hypothetical protein P43SY_002643 [Pythium insidiosum]|uniref:Histone chaperone n=1 Tax=Pythium insidiosum TaxID=114742 RepID=A0AAD5LR62_PYTIN|nr:hypothetical protein P43SY_002643 [Pythium insidiosum]
MTKEHKGDSHGAEGDGVTGAAGSVAGAKSQSTGGDGGAAKKKSASKNRKRKTSDAGVATAKGSASAAKKIATDEAKNDKSAGEKGGAGASGAATDGAAAAVANIKPFVQGELLESIKQMMFGFGDDAEPLDETAQLMEELVVEYVENMTKKAMEVSILKGKIDPECFIFLIRKDPERYERINKLLHANDEFRAVLNSGFDPSDDKIETPAAFTIEVGNENAPPPTQFGLAQEVTAFDEYRDGDIDDMDILPSQDFDNDIVTTPARASAPRNVTSGWVDFRDGTQFHEELSEVFDNGFDVAPKESGLIASNVEPRLEAAPRSTAPPSSAPSVATTRMTSPEWVERRSVKRDSTFVASPPRRRRVHIEELPPDLGESSEEFEEKLKLDDVIASSPGEPALRSPRDPGLTSPSGSSPFLARRSRKRRKVRQLALDGFLQPQPPPPFFIMAYVTLTNITVLDNPTAFTNPFQFEVTFECAHALEDDLEWKITYVGSAEDESRDQILEEVLVGPVPVGTNKFVFQSDAPNPDLIPEEDKIGVTVVLVTCSYRGREFVRVGYYVNNDYADPFLLENPPARVDVARLQRNILADKPRVTRFPIDWASSAVQDIGNENGADEDELVKAAAQLDHQYTDIVIDNNEPQDEVMEDDDLEQTGEEYYDDEEDENSVEEGDEVDLEGDQDMEDDEEIDLDDEL